MLPLPQLWLLVAITTLLSIEAKAPPGYIKPPEIRDEHPPKYHYSYKVEDGKGRGQGKAEARSGIYAKGRYYVQGADSNYNVQYYADDWGFHPLVQYGNVGPHSKSKTHLALGEEALKALKNSEPSSKNNLPKKQQTQIQQEPVAAHTTQQLQQQYPQAVFIQPVQIPPIMDQQQPAVVQPTQELILHQQLPAFIVQDQQQQTFVIQGQPDPQREMVQTQQGQQPQLIVPDNNQQSVIIQEQQEQQQQQQQQQQQHQQLPPQQQQNQAQQQTVLVQDQLPQQQSIIVHDQPQAVIVQEQPQQQAFLVHSQVQSQTEAPQQAALVQSQPDRAQEAAVIQQQIQQALFQNQLIGQNQQNVLNQQQQQAILVQDHHQQHALIIEDQPQQQALIMEAQPEQSIMFLPVYPQLQSQHLQFVEQQSATTIKGSQDVAKDKIQEINNRQKESAQSLVNIQEERKKTNIDIRSNIPTTNIHHTLANERIKDSQNEITTTPPQRIQTEVLFEGRSNQKEEISDEIEQSSQESSEESVSSKEYSGNFGEKISDSNTPTTSLPIKLIETTRNLVSGEDVLNINGAASENSEENVIEGTTPHSAISEYASTLSHEGSTLSTKLEITQLAQESTTATSLLKEPIVVAEVEDNSLKASTAEITEHSKIVDEFAFTGKTTQNTLQYKGTSPSTVLVTPRPVSSSFLAPITAGIQLQNVEHSTAVEEHKNTENVVVEIQKSQPYYLGKFEYIQRPILLNQEQRNKQGIISAEQKAAENIALTKTILNFPGEVLPQPQFLIQRLPKIETKQQFNAKENRIESTSNEKLKEETEQKTDNSQKSDQEESSQRTVQTQHLQQQVSVQQQNQQIQQEFQRQEQQRQQDQQYNQQQQQEQQRQQDRHYFQQHQQLQYQIQKQISEKEKLQHTNIADSIKLVATPTPYPYLEAKLLPRPSNAAHLLHKHYPVQIPIHVPIHYPADHNSHEKIVPVYQFLSRTNSKVPSSEKNIKKPIYIPYEITHPYPLINTAPAEHPNHHHEARPYPIEFKIPIQVPQTYVLPVEVPKPYPVQREPQKPFPNNQQNYHQEHAKVPAPTQQSPIYQYRDQQPESQHHLHYYYVEPANTHVKEYLPPMQETNIINRYLPPKDPPNSYLPPEDCDEAQSASGTFYRTIRPDDYIGLLPPKQAAYHHHYLPRKFRSARSNFDNKNLRLEYGFMPPLIPSMEIDEFGNPIERNEK